MNNLSNVKSDVSYENNGLVVITTYNIMSSAAVNP